MKIDIKDILTLDDGIKYVVVSKINYDDKNYYYLIEINSNDNVKFCYQDGNELVECMDKELITKLIPIFSEVSKNNLSNH